MKSPSTDRFTLDLLDDGKYFAYRIEIILADFDIAMDVVILDDGANEIADIVWVQGKYQALSIHHHQFLTVKS